MKRGTPSLAAAATAFAWSRRGARQASHEGDTKLHLHPAALAFVVGFPGVIGAVALIAALSRSLPDDGALPMGVGFLGLAAVLLVLGVRSVLSVRQDRLTVRFFGLRSTTIQFTELRSATFGMRFPSVSFAIALTDRAGRNAIVHANWWRYEASAVVPICRALLKWDVPMDRSTARIVSQVLKVKRPKARIIHHGLLRNDRTW
jgi:hypothetical protein